MALFGVHFDGAITTEDHKVSIRILSNTYEHMQRSIDRAYLINKHGQVWKHARLKGVEYQETEFIAQYPREGGIILDAVREGADAIIDRVAAAIKPVFEEASTQAVEKAQSIADQYQRRLQYVADMGAATQTFESVKDSPPSVWAPGYSNRSVVKEIDPLVSVITRQEGSLAEIILVGSRTHPVFRFTPLIAHRFHLLASRRDLATPMIVNVRLRILDRGNKKVMPSAKIENVATEREVTLHLPERSDFDVLHPFHDGREIKIYASPITESLGFDLYGGDLMFLDLVG